MLWRARARRYFLPTSRGTAIWRRRIGSLRMLSAKARHTRPVSISNRKAMCHSVLRCGDGLVRMLPTPPKSGRMGANGPVQKRLLLARRHCRIIGCDTPKLSIFRLYRPGIIAAGKFVDKTDSLRPLGYDQLVDSRNRKDWFCAARTASINKRLNQTPQRSVSMETVCGKRSGRRRRGD